MENNLTGISLIEKQLATQLPDDYRQFLLAPPPDITDPLIENSIVPLHFYPPESKGEPYRFPNIVGQFLREWHPLRGALCPVEYLGEGLFACLHLLDPYDRPVPVVLWDVTADLMEQPFCMLALDWPHYYTARLNGFSPIEANFNDLRHCRIKGELNFEKSVEVFESFSKWFHDQYQNQNQNDVFEHDGLNRMPRYDEWRPERFCVHDHLLGVMGYRFSPLAGRIEVTGFVTKDHTNYARGSATCALLTSLLTEWAKQSAPAGIVFVDQWRNYHPKTVSLPVEVALFAYLQGIPMRSDAYELKADDCQALLTRLTPIVVKDSQHSAFKKISDKACLLVQKQVLLPHQVEDLIRFCPLAEPLFKGQIHMHEQIRLNIVLEHLQLSFMARVIEQVLNLAVASTNFSCVLEKGDSNQQMPYCWEGISPVSLQLKGLDVSGPALSTISAGTSFCLIPWPVNKSDFSLKSFTFIQYINALYGKNHPDFLAVVVPEESTGNHLPEYLAKSLGNITIVTVTETYQEIKKSAWQAFQKINQLRS